MQEHVIEFVCWKGDDPIEIQLEPDALIFRVTADNEIKFVAHCESPFTWAVRMGKDNEAQLFPNSLGHYEIEIYENGVLLEDWWKYM